MSERITDSSALKHGDVAMIAVELTDKVTGAPFWWRRFGVVLDPLAHGRWARVMTLKLNVDPDKDFREIDLLKDVLTLVPESSMPQGVAAMFMKHVALGTFRLGEG